MSYRNVIITKRCKLDVKMGYLVIRDENVKRIFLDEIDMLMLENPAVSLTGCLIEELMNRKIKLIFCDKAHSPIAETVACHGSHDSSLKIRLQSSWTEEIKGLVWQKIVSRKIHMQAEFLRELGKEREQSLLTEYEQTVLPHDSTNREGHAAKVYFNALFGMDFTRTEDSPVNAALNYGYTMLNSAFNREIVANGYLTQIGIFHDNMFNHFNLTSDIMEPFRILTDRMVYKLKPEKFDKDERHYLWRLFSEAVSYKGNIQLVSAAIRLYTKNVLDCISNGTPDEIVFYENL